MEFTADIAAEMTDREFDRVFQESVRALSKVHWTPIEVARRAAELLVPDSSSRVLDLGSGAGKFCLVGAMSTEGHFVGVESRKNLVSLSKQLAQRLKLDRAEFICDDALNLDWSGFSGIYLFNPFEEHISEKIQFEPAGEFSPKLYKKSVELTVSKLAALPQGTRAVTFHGFGGVLSPEYRLISEDRFRAGVLQCWVRQGGETEATEPLIWEER